jgi:hypothetical protein
MGGAAPAEENAPRAAGGEMIPPMAGGGAGGGRDSEHRNRYVREKLFEEVPGPPPVVSDPDYQPGAHQPSEDESSG